MSVYLALFTLADRNGFPLRQVADRRLTDKFSAAIVGSLRKTDIVASCSFCQFVVMMPLATLQDVERITQRIEKSFRFSCRRENVILQTAYSSLE